MLFVSVNVKNSLSLTDRNWCWPKRVWTRRIENATTKQLLAIEHKIDFSVRCWTDFVHSFVERSLSLVPSAWTHRTRHRVGALCCSSVIVIGMRRTETVWIEQNSCFIWFFFCVICLLWFRQCCARFNWIITKFEVRKSKKKLSLFTIYSSILIASERKRRK